MNNEKGGHGLLALIGGIIIGAAAGAAAGVLFAPAKGATTRKKIARKAHYMTEEMKDKIEGIKESLDDIMDEVKDKAEHTMKKHMG